MKISDYELTQSIRKAFFEPEPVKAVPKVVFYIDYVNLARICQLEDFVRTCDKGSCAYNNRGIYFLEKGVSK